MIVWVYFWIELCVPLQSLYLIVFDSTTQNVSDAVIEVNEQLMRSEKIMISSHTSESTGVFVPHSDWLQYCETKPGQQRFACQGT